MILTFIGVVNSDAKRIGNFCQRSNILCCLVGEDNELQNVSIPNFNKEITLTTCRGDDLILTSNSTLLKLVISVNDFERVIII